MNPTQEDKITSILSDLDELIRSLGQDLNRSLEENAGGSVAGVGQQIATLSLAYSKVQEAAFHNKLP